MRALSMLPARMAALAGVAALTATFVIAGGAGAVTESGKLFVKGTGSLYGRQTTTNMAARPGKTTTFGLEVKNNGTAAAQYKLTFNPTFGTVPVTEAMYAGSTQLPNTYWTPLVAPGGTYLLTVRETPATTAPQASYYSNVQLALADTGVQQAVKSLAIHMAAPKVGTGPADLFVKNGAQPTEGGSVSYQYMAAPSVKVGATAKFTLTVQNDSSSAHVVTVVANSSGDGTCDPAAFVVTFKNGSTDVTAAITSAAGWMTPNLAPGGKTVLTLSVKYAVAQPSCNALYVYASTYIGSTLEVFESTQTTIAV